MDSKSTAANIHRPSSDMSSFGVFYPVGYIVVGFPGPGDAELVQRNLMSGGYEAKDCTLMTAKDVAVSAKANLEENTGFLARLGAADEAVRAHLDAANDGATFLLIYAPGDLDASRAMNVIRTVNFAFAHRYHRLTIEDLK